MEKTEYTEGILGHIKELIKYDVNSCIDRPQSHYINSAYECLQRRIQAMSKSSHYQPWNIKHRKQVEDIWKELQPDVIVAVDRFIQEFKHKKLTKDIKAATAKAAIKIAMQEAGFKHQFTGQTHRAKVSVLMGTCKVMSFYISYKKLNEELPRIVESLKVIRQELEHFGKDVTIYKTYNGAMFI